eukprot:m51a1_g10839 hypothetical protein (1698) ;mRNA; f:3230-13540
MLTEADTGAPPNGEIEMEMGVKQGRVIFKTALLADAPTDVLELNDAVEALGFGRFQWCLGLVCGTIMALDAAELLTISFLVPLIAEYWHLTYIKQLFISGATFAGMGIGNYGWGWMSDHLGRLPVILAVPFISGFFSLASAFSPNVWVLSFLRFFAGIGVGAFGVAFNLFAEFLPAGKRGKILALFQGVWTIGIFTQSGIAWVVVPRLGWRWMLGIGSTPYFILMLLLPFASESPRYYLVHGKAAKAQNVLKRISKVNRRALPSGILVAMDDVHCGKMTDLIKKPLRKVSLLIWAIFFSNNIAYYGLVMFTPVYFKTLSKTTEYLSSLSSSATATTSETLSEELTKLLIASAAEFPGVIFSALFIDYFGRKRLQYFMLISAGLCSLVLAFPVNAWVGLILCFTARMFIIGSLQTAWVYTPEVYPTTIRTTAMGTANTIGKSASLLSPFMSTYLFSWQSWAPAAVMGTFGIIGGICAFVLPVETSGSGLVDVMPSANASEPKKQQKPAHTTEPASVDESDRSVSEGKTSLEREREPMAPASDREPMAAMSRMMSSGGSYNTSPPALDAPQPQAGQPQQPPEPQQQQQGGAAEGQQAAQDPQQLQQAALPIAPELVGGTTLSAEDFCRLSCVSRHVHDAATSDAVWERLYLRDLGAPCDAVPGNAWRARYIADMCRVQLFAGGNARAADVLRRAPGVRVQLSEASEMPVDKYQPESNFQGRPGVRFEPVPRIPMRVQGFQFARAAAAGNGLRMALFAPPTTGSALAFTLDCLVPIAVRRHDVVQACLPGDQVRWGVLFVDERYAKRNGAGARWRYRDTAVVFLWSPDEAPVRSKMIAAGMAESLVSALGASVAVQMQASAVEELTLESILYKATSPLLSDKAKYPHFLRVCSSLALSSLAMIQMFSKYGITRIAGIGNNDSYGQGGLQKLVTYAARAEPPIEVVATIYYPPTINNPAAIANTTIVMGMATAVDHNPVTDHFVSSMTQYMKYDKLLSLYYSSFEYDATLAWIYAVKKILAAGQDPYNRTLLYSTLRSLEFTGSTGDISFDDSGDRFATMTIFRFVSGNENLAIVGNWTVGNGVLIDPIHAPWSLLTSSGSVKRSIAPQVAGGVLGGVAFLVIAGAVAGSFMWHQRKVQRTLILKIETEKNSYRVNSDEMQLGKELGQGSYGTVYQAQWRGTEVAAKVILLGKHVDVDEERLLQEVSIMKSLRHPSLLLFMCYAKTCEKLIIVTEFMPHGSLLDLLSDKAMPLSTSIKLRILNDVAAGMAYLHGSNPPIIHCDLKSSNILLSESMQAKVCDFGLTVIAQKHSSSTTQSDDSVLGSLLWSAPEIINNGVFSTKSDVYAFGIMLWEMVTRELPYKDMNPVLVSSYVAEKNLRPDVGPAFENVQPLRELMEQCWDKSPDARPDTVSELPHQVPDDVEDLYKRFSQTTAPSWAIAANDVETVKEVTERGNFGVVFKGTWRSQTVAVKKFFRQKVDSVTMTEIELQIKEIVTLSNIRHPNIVLFMGACTEPHNMFVVTEWMDMGNLLQLISSSHQLEKQRGVAILISTCSALTYLHQCGIVHRDLKSSNILLNKNMDVKVSDFGMAAVKTANKISTLCGTIAWMAPEVLSSGAYSEASDVYSFGIVMSEILSGEVPFKGLNKVVVAREILQGQRPDVPRKLGAYGSAYVELMRRCWGQEPSQRPTFKAIGAELAGM